MILILLAFVQIFLESYEVLVARLLPRFPRNHGTGLLKFNTRIMQGIAHNNGHTVSR